MALHFAVLRQKRIKNSAVCSLKNWNYATAMSFSLIGIVLLIDKLFISILNFYPIKLLNKKGLFWKKVQKRKRFFVLQVLQLLFQIKKAL